MMSTVSKTTGHVKKGKNRETKAALHGRIAFQQKKWWPRWMAFLFYIKRPVELSGDVTLTVLSLSLFCSPYQTSCLLNRNKYQVWIGIKRQHSHILTYCITTLNSQSWSFLFCFDFFLSCYFFGWKKWRNKKLSLWINITFLFFQDLLERGFETFLLMLNFPLWIHNTGSLSNPSSLTAKRIKKYIPIKSNIKKKREKIRNNDKDI